MVLLIPKQITDLHVEQVDILISKNQVLQILYHAIVIIVIYSIVIPYGWLFLRAKGDFGS